MPELNGLLETSLYVDDLGRSARFYQAVLGLQPLFTDERLIALGVAGRQVLLLFLRGASQAPSVVPGGTIPGHDGDGQFHLAFAIGKEELPAWEQRLEEQGVPIESRVTWPRGGQSLYFRDPDGHLVELVTPGIWAIY